MTNPASDAIKPTAFITASRTHVGLVRQINEDRVLVQPQIGLWAIADGMGGHSLGDRAAAAVVSALSAIGPRRPSEEMVHEAVQSANIAIYECAQSAGVVGGSTVAGLVISGEATFVFWVGDSRVYRLRNEQLTQLTTDHSIVQELRDAGVLPEHQIRTDPRRNIITRAVGIQMDARLDVAPIDVLQDDLFLICSDGLTDLVDDANLAGLLNRELIERSAEDLVRMALAQGGTDNISIIVIASAPAYLGPLPE